jgi:hypothetical protein
VGGMAGRQGDAHAGGAGKARAARGDGVSRSDAVGRDVMAKQMLAQAEE